MKMALAQLAQLVLCSVFLQGSSLKMVFKDAMDAKDVEVYNPQTDDYVSELDGCYKDEDERLRRQKEMMGWLSWLGIGLDAICGEAPDLGSGESERPTNKLFLQLEDVTQHLDQYSGNATMVKEEVLPMAVIAGVACGVAQLGTAVAGEFVSREHDRQNSQAVDCDRLAAMMTQVKLAALEKKLESHSEDMKEEFDKVEKQLGAMQKSMDHNHQKTRDLVDHLAREEDKNQYLNRQLIQSHVMDGINALSKDTALLAAKLDDVMQRITQSMELTEVSHYKELAVRLVAAAAVIRGANDDILSAEQDKRRHDVNMPRIHLDKAKLRSARVALKDWEETSLALSEKVQSEVQVGWRRARDAFAEVASVLLTGDLIYLHFKLRMRTKAAEIMAQWPKTSSLEDEFVQFSLGPLLDKMLLEDPILQVLFTSMNDAASVMEMYLAVFPNYEDVSEFEDSLHEVTKYMTENATGVRDRMKQVSFLVSILEAPVLTEFPIDQECLRSAFRQGYTATDAMVTWKPGATSEIAIASHALAGESQDAFFECKSVPLTKPSGFNKDHYSFPVNGKNCKWNRWDGSPPDGFHRSSYQEHIKTQCDKKEIEVEIQCPKDYELKGLEIDRATFDCKSEFKTPQAFSGGAGDSQYTVIYIIWTCYTKAGERYDLDKMATCHLMTDAMRKTFRPLDKKVNPFDPSQSTLLSHDKAFGPLASFFEKVSGRTHTVRTTGQTCNNLQKGAHGLRVGPNYLQVGDFRFRADAWHLWVDGPRKVSQIYRRDQMMFRGGRASIWPENGRNLTSLDMKIPENWGIHFGDRFIQLGNWRLADMYGTHFSISYMEHGEAPKVVQVLRSDGTSHLMRGVSPWHAWGRKVGAPQNIFMGHKFIQIGEWRLADLETMSMVITHIKTGKTASMFDNHRGTAVHGGGESHPEVLARPICPPSAPEV